MIFGYAGKSITQFSSRFFFKSPKPLYKIKNFGGTKMELLNIDIPYSVKDKYSKISLPNNLNEELAEFVGIIIGDGHLSHQIRKYSNFYSLTISCNYTEDMDYFNNVINPLFEKLFNARLSTIKNKKLNYFNAVKCSKSVVNFLNLNFSIPIGNKTSDVKVPQCILRTNDSIKCAFVRGLTDTDFSLAFQNRKQFHSYPIIKCSLKSKLIIFQLSEILVGLGFKARLAFNERNFDKRFNVNYERHLVYLSGKDNLEKWISLIGFNNPRLHSKYLIWQNFGFCPPNTTLEQRKQILAGSIDPRSFYK